MITLFQIDKSGGEIFEKDYSIVLIVNQSKIYGINIPQKIKDDLNFQFKSNLLNIKSDSEKKKKKRFKLRFHVAVVIKLIQRALLDIKNIEDVNFQICNDFDGHFHEIKDMLYKNLISLIPLLKKEDFVSTKFQKPSKIDVAAKAFRNKETLFLDRCTKLNLNSEELIKIVKK